MPLTALVKSTCVLTLATQKQAEWPHPRRREVMSFGSWLGFFPTFVKLRWHHYCHCHHQTDPSLKSPCPASHFRARQFLQQVKVTVTQTKSAPTLNAPSTLKCLVGSTDMTTHAFMMFMTWGPVAGDRVHYLLSNKHIEEFAESSTISTEKAYVHECKASTNSLNSHPSASL